MPSKPKLRAGDLEFLVYLDEASPNTATVYSRKYDAILSSLGLALSTGEQVTIDVLAWSKAAAVIYAGPEGGDQYDEDPEASVFDRLIITATSLGRIA